MRPSGLAKVIFDLQWISYIYFLVTLLTCVRAMFKSSFAVGAMALVASALCYFGTAGFVGSFRARLHAAPTNRRGSTQASELWVTLGAE
jgi:hypothetical protein